MVSRMVEIQMDPEDLLADSLQTLYDYTPITHSSAGATFEYQPSQAFLDTFCVRMSQKCEPFSITIKTPTTQAANWSLHASSIWASSLYMAEHLYDLGLEQHVATARDRGQTSIRLLELGAGAGLPSILIAKLVECARVTVSDYPDEQLIEALASNVRSNDVSQRCRAVPYAWGADPTIFQLETEAGSDHTFDIVIAADTLWNSELHSLFLQALQLTLRRSADARVHMVAGLHTGRYTLQAFMDAVPQYGFVFEKVAEREVAGSSVRPWDVGRHEAEDEKERRRWVVWMVLKWESIDVRR